jgi:hypothetical protein
MAELLWRVDSRGAYVANGLVRQYEVLFEVRAADCWYQVRVDGYPIGRSSTEPGGKAIAQAHNDRD